MFKKFDTSSSSNQIPQKALPGKGIAIIMEADTGSILTL